jgi:hypothetical protein
MSITSTVRLNSYTQAHPNLDRDLHTLRTQLQQILIEFDPALLKSHNNR